MDSTLKQAHGIKLKYPSDIMKVILCECLKYFVSEAKRGDGVPYPPKYLVALSAYYMAL